MGVMVCLSVLHSNIDKVREITNVIIPKKVRRKFIKSTIDFSKRDLSNGKKAKTNDIRQFL